MGVRPVGGRQERGALRKNFTRAMKASLGRPIWYLSVERRCRRVTDVSILLRSPPPGRRRGR